MSDDALAVMNATLQKPISRESESYGLKNLHQRLVLYYGPDCGVRVQRNGRRGMCVHYRPEIQDR